MSHVLVVDDNPLTLQFFGDALAAIDIACTRAADGKLAIGLAAHRCFDLLLIDARMPGLDGRQTLHAIRSGDGASCNTLAIATTAADDVPPAELLDAGFVDVITKPIDLASLRARLSRHLLPASTVDAGHHSNVSALFDDTRALAAAGNDAAIVVALRGLLAGELDALPAEFAELARNRDRGGMRERLHRLAASAGFCGAPALAAAVARLRVALDDTRDLQHTLGPFLATCVATRAALDEPIARTPLELPRTRQAGP